MPHGRGAGLTVRGSEEGFFFLFKDRKPLTKTGCMQQTKISPGIVSEFGAATSAVEAGIKDSTILNNGQMEQHSFSGIYTYPKRKIDNDQLILTNP